MGCENANEVYQAQCSDKDCLKVKPAPIFQIQLEHAMAMLARTWCLNCASVLQLPMCCPHAVSIHSHWKLAKRTTSLNLKWCCHLCSRYLVSNLNSFANFGLFCGWAWRVCGLYFSRFQMHQKTHLCWRCAPEMKGLYSNRVHPTTDSSVWVRCRIAPNSAKPCHHLCPVAICHNEALWQVLLWQSGQNLRGHLTWLLCRVCKKVDLTLARAELLPRACFVRESQVKSKLSTKNGRKRQANFKTFDFQFDLLRVHACFYTARKLISCDKFVHDAVRIRHQFAIKFREHSSRGNEKWQLNQI